MSNATAPAPLLLIDLKELARLTGLSDRTLWGMCKQKKIPHLYVGRCLRFDPEAIRAWIREKQEAAASVV